MTPSVMALAGDAPCHLPQRGRHFGSLSEGAVERSETEGVLPFFRALSLDFAEGGCYTQFVRNQGQEASVFWFSCIRIPALQLHTGRMMDSERDRAGRGAEGEGKNSQAKGSDLDDTSESAGWPAHQRGNRQPSG